MNITKKESERLQTYLQKKLGGHSLRVLLPERSGQPVELCVQKGQDLESIGTVYRDEEEGEVSYSIFLTVLEEDLA